jgi:hypothetical protein
METNSIKVVIRIRPLQKHEKSKGEQVVAKSVSNGKEVQLKSGPNKAQIFQCHRCFSRDTTQAELFQQCGIIELLEASLRGARSCAFAFGQTGAGKTHTVVGSAATVDVEEHLTHSGNGMLGRAFAYIFKAISSGRRIDGKDASTFSVRVSCLEIYHEQVYDLLADKGERQPLNLREHQQVSTWHSLSSLLSPHASHFALHFHTDICLVWFNHGNYQSQDGFYAEGSTKILVPTVKEACKVATGGMRSRKLGAHDLNSRSNRSHCVTEIFVDSGSTPDQRTALNSAEIGARTGRQTDKGSSREVGGRMTFVDLAGSERLKATNSTGKVLQEAGFINKSLYVLGKVIAGLVRTGGDLSHRDVPYRDSKLTKLLISSMQASAANTSAAGVSTAHTAATSSIPTSSDSTPGTILIACVTEGSGSLAETSRTLHFSMSAARVKVKPIHFLSEQDKLIQELRQQVHLLRRENTHLKNSASVSGLEKGSGAGAPIDHYNHSPGAGAGAGRLGDKRSMSGQAALDAVVGAGVGADSHGKRQSSAGLSRSPGHPRIVQQSASARALPAVAGQSQQVQGSRRVQRAKKQKVQGQGHGQGHGPRAHVGNRALQEPLDEEDEEIDLLYGDDHSTSHASHVSHASAPVRLSGKSQVSRQEINQSAAVMALGPQGRSMFRAFQPVRANKNRRAPASGDHRADGQSHQQSSLNSRAEMLLLAERERLLARETEAALLLQQRENAQRERRIEMLEARLEAVEESGSPGSHGSQSSLRSRRASGAKRAAALPPLARHGRSPELGNGAPWDAETQPKQQQRRRRGQQQNMQGMRGAKDRVLAEQRRKHREYQEVRTRKAAQQQQLQQKREEVSPYIRHVEKQGELLEMAREARRQAAQGARRRQEKERQERLAEALGGVGVGGRRGGGGLNSKASVHEQGSYYSMEGPAVEPEAVLPAVGNKKAKTPKKKTKKKASKLPHITSTAVLDGALAPKQSASGPKSAQKRAGKKGGVHSRAQQAMYDASSEGYDANYGDSDNEFDPQIRGVEQSLDEMEALLAKQREEMEENPGGVTADNEEAVEKLEGEVRIVGVIMHYCIFPFFFFCSPAFRVLAHNVQSSLSFSLSFFLFLSLSLSLIRSETCVPRYNTPKVYLLLVEVEMEVLVPTPYRPRTSITITTRSTVHRPRREVEMKMMTMETTSSMISNLTLKISKRKSRRMQKKKKKEKKKKKKKKKKAGHWRTRTEVQMLTRPM